MESANTVALFELAIFVLTGVELSINLMIIPIAIVNFIIISQTAVVHPNLKFVLLVQSALILTIALIRSIFDFTKFVQHNPYASVPMAVVTILVFAMQFLDFLGHVLFAERVAATIWARWYERAPANWSLNTVWFIALFISSAVYCWFQMYTTLNTTSLLNLVVNYALVALSLCEWLGLAFVAWHNRVRYNLFTFHDINNKRSTAVAKNKIQNSLPSTLSERYQLSENVRTGRQLALCFAMHFVDVACISVLVSQLYFFTNINRTIGSTINALINVVYGAADLIILVSIILYHPVLHRNAFRLWQNLRSLLGLSSAMIRISPGGGSEEGNSSVNNGTTAKVSIQLRSLDGRLLATGIDVGGREHFEMLRAQWNQ